MSYLFYCFPRTVVKQYFEAQVYDVFVMRGNTAIFKCNLPSFVSDHVDLLEWISTENTTYKHGDDEQGATTCFVTISPASRQLFSPFVTASRPFVVSKSIFLMFLVVSHHYSVNVMDEHVLKGNTGIFQCHIPSFVSDFVTIDAWIDDEDGEEFRSNTGDALGTFLNHLV